MIKKSNLKKQWDSTNLQHFTMSNQISSLGPYGMYGDVTQKYRLQGGRLVPDVYETLPLWVKRKLARVNKIAEFNLKKKSGKVIEEGDFNGNFIRYA